MPRHGESLATLPRNWYNGYSWTGDERVYNPFSILNYFDKGEFRNYWFESGTPTFLIELFKQKRYYIPQLENLEAGESIIGSFDIDFIEPENLLFQAGYLTIEGVRQEFGDTWYRLNYPNREVKTSLNNYILKHYSGGEGVVSGYKLRLIEALKKCDIDGMVEVMHSHFASIPHDWYRKNKIDKYEGYYASVFYAYFASIGVEVRAEDATSQGKIDMAVVMADKVLIFEFKCLGRQGIGDRKLELGDRRLGIGKAIKKKEPKAIEQLRAKGYAEKYRALNKPIYLIGIDFDRKKRNIVDFKWEAG